MNALSIVNWTVPGAATPAPSVGDGANAEPVVPQDVASLTDIQNGTQAASHFATHPLSPEQSKALYSNFQRLFDAPPSPNGGPVGKANLQGIEDPALRQLLGSGAAYRANDGTLHVGSLAVSRDDDSMTFSVPQQGEDPIDVFELQKAGNNVLFLPKAPGEG